jgi:protein involved in polysaccharide export with SLBB domain
MQLLTGKRNMNQIFRPVCCQQPTTDASATQRNSQRRCPRQAAPPTLHWFAVAALALSMAGCSSFNQLITGIPAIPAHRVPPEFLGRKRTEMQDITLSRLRQNPPKVHQLAPNDVLGIYIENVLGTAEEPPPVNYNILDSSKPPSLGFPVPVREDGTLALPLVDPIPVTGLTLAQATDAIRDAYTVTKQILPVGKDRIIVTLQRPREYRVLVVREEAGASAGATGNTGVSLAGGGGGGANQMTGFLKRGMGANVLLPAYENDVLSALNKTGGMPGLDAKNEVLIIRGNFRDAAERDRWIAQIKSMQDPCECEIEIPDDINITRIPLRFYPENVPDFTEEDIILQNGDIVMVQSREREQYYTGGAIRGGAHLVPRDYDIDILQAIALAGGTIGQGGAGLANNGFGRGGGGGNRGLPPSRAIVLRKTCNGGEIPIKVDLNRAIIAPGERILIQPEDTIIVQYTCLEEIYNFALQTVSFNFLTGLGGNGIN